MVNFTQSQIDAAIKKGMDEFDRLYRENLPKLGGYDELSGMKWAANGFVNLKLQCLIAIDEHRASEIPGYIDEEKNRSLSPRIDPLYQKALLEIENELRVLLRSQDRGGRTP